MAGAGACGFVNSVVVVACAPVSGGMLWLRRLVNSSGGGVFGYCADGDANVVHEQLPKSRQGMQQKIGVEV